MSSKNVPNKKSLQTKPKTQERPIERKERPMSKAPVRASAKPSGKASASKPSGKASAPKPKGKASAPKPQRKLNIRDMSDDEETADDMMISPDQRGSKSSSSSFVKTLKRALKPERKLDAPPRASREASEDPELDDSEEEMPLRRRGKEPVVERSESEGETPGGSSNGDESEIDAEEFIKRTSKSDHSYLKNLRELLKSGYTDGQARMALEVEYTQHQAEKKLRKAKPQVAYQALSEMGFRGTVYPHRPTMDAMGVTEDVETMLKAMGVSRLATLVCNTYPEETTQFLATVETHVYLTTPTTLLARDGAGYITFSVNGEDYRVTFRQIEEIYGFAPGAGCFPDIELEELDEVWEMISGMSPFVASRSKGNWIRNPAINYARRVVANLIGARPSVGPINVSEMCLLDMGLKEVIGTTVLGRELLGDESASSLAFMLAQQFKTYRSRALKQKGKRAKPIHIGGVVTPILIYCKIKLNEKAVIPPRYMDMRQLKTSFVLASDSRMDKIIYNIFHPDDTNARILLPCQHLSSLVNALNVEFAYPLDDFTQVPLEDPTNQPNQAPNITRQTQVNEEEFEPESLYFDEFTRANMGVGAIEAHKRIGKLQKIGKWLVKKVRGFSKERDDWKAEREAMRKEMNALKETFSGELAKHKEFVERRHSVSETRQAPSMMEPARASTGQAPRTTKKRNPSIERIKVKYAGSTSGEVNEPGTEQVQIPGLAPEEASLPTHASVFEMNDNMPTMPEMQVPQYDPNNYTLDGMNASTAHLFNL